MTRAFDLTLDPGIGYKIAELAREFEEEDAILAGEDDTGDALIIDEAELVTRAEADHTDPIQTELTGMIEALSLDAQRDLLALLWVGRGVYTSSEWSEARRQAREVPHMHVAQYLEETPLASDYLIEGLAAMGYTDTGDAPG